MAGPVGDDGDDGDGDTRTEGEAPPRRVLSAGPEFRTARPERPQLSDTTPAPVFGKDSMPPSLKRTQSMWYLAVTMLFFGIVTMALTRVNLSNHLAELLAQQDASNTVAGLADASPYVVYIAIVALLVIVVPEWGFATMLSRRRHWPRIVMVPIALLHATVAGLCLLIIPLEVWQGWLLFAVTGLGAVTALVAALRGFAPSATRWIRTRHEDEAVYAG